MFKVGDEVSHPIKGIGEVKVVLFNGDLVYVAYYKWDKYHSFAGSLGKGEKNGWWEYSNHVTLVPTDLENV